MRGLFRYYRVGQFSLQLFAILLAGLVCWNSFHVFFADSEIWSVNLGYHFKQDIGDLWVFTRFIFHGLLFLATSWLSRAEDILLAARALMVLNILLQIVLLKKITYETTHSRFLSWLAPVLMLSCSFFVTQAFRIRSDIILGTWILAVVYIVNFSKWKVQGFMKRLGIYLLSVFVTPKALFYLPIFIILDKRSGKPQLAFGFLFVPIFITIVYFLTLVRLGFLSDAAINFFSYFRSSFASDEGVAYFSLDAFTYVARFIKENIALSIVCLSSILFIYLERKKNLSKYVVRSGWLTAYMTLMWIFFPDRVPFFLCSFIPLIAYSATVVVQQVFWTGDLRIKNYPIVIFSALLLLHLFVSGVFLLTKVESKGVTSNREQLGTIKVIREYLDKYPGVNYYDVIGIIPEKNDIRLFAGPHQKSINEMTRQHIQELEPDILLKNSKFGYFEPQISLFLKDKYINIGNGVYLRSKLAGSSLPSQEILKKVSTNADLIKYDKDFSRFPKERPLMMVEDSKGNTRVLGFPIYIAPDEKIIKVSALPRFSDLPNRSLIDLFKFDSEF